MAEWAINPLSLFLAVWGGTIASYLWGLQAGLFPPGTSGAAWAMLLNVVTFSLGYLTWSAFRRLETLRHKVPQSSGAPLTARQLKTALNITLVFGLVALVSSAARVVVLSRTFHTDLSRFVSDPALWRRAVTAMADESDYVVRLCTIAITLSSAIFSIGFVLLGIILYFGRSKRRYGYVLLFLLVSLAVGLLSLGRKEVAINILFLILSYLFVHRVYRTRRTAEVLRSLFIPPAALAVLFILIDMLLHKSETFGRESRLAGFLFSLYWYIASPLAAFAEFMKDHGHTYAMGQSLFFPLYKWLYRLHLASASIVSPRMEMLHIPYPANVYSYLRNIYEDFGFIGVAIVPYVLGALSADMRRHAEAFLPYLNLYVALLVVIIFSVYNYLLMSNQLYLQIVLALLFFRFPLTDLDKLSL